MFHWGCTRPQLILSPVGHWFCPYCNASDGSATETEKQSATLFVEDINNLKREAKEAMLKRSSPTLPDSNVPSTKRLRSSPPQENIETTTENRAATPTNEASAGNAQSPTPNAIPNDAKEFVDLFFLKGKAKQEELLKAILTDQRVTEVLPSASSMATNTQNQSNGTSLNYNNQIIDIADPTKYRPLQHNAFHWFPPNINNGIHRSLDQRNVDRSNFNITRAANKSCLVYANKINHFVMNLHLSNEQRRSALWKSFSLPGMMGMIQSYGFNTKSMNIGLLIATNVSRFMEYCRTTNHRKGKGTNAQRMAVNALTAGAMSTPPPRITGQSNTRQRRAPGNIPVRDMCGFLGIPIGSHHLIEKCGEFRRAAKEGLDTAFDFLGPR